MNSHQSKEENNIKYQMINYQVQKEVVNNDYISWQYKKHK